MDLITIADKLIEVADQSNNDIRLKNLIKLKKIVKDNIYSLSFMYSFIENSITTIEKMIQNECIDSEIIYACRLFANRLLFINNRD